jgi:hypothetical protein
VDIWNRKRLEGGITDLFFFPRTDEQGVRRMELILCVRRALTEAGSLILEPHLHDLHGPEEHRSRSTTTSSSNATAAPSSGP